MSAKQELMEAHPLNGSPNRFRQARVAGYGPIVLLIAILALSFFLSYSRTTRGLPYLYNWDEVGSLNTVLWTLKTGDFNQFSTPRKDYIYDGFSHWLLLPITLLHYVRLASTGVLKSAVEIDIFDGANWEWRISHPSFFCAGRVLYCFLGSACLLVLYKIAAILYDRKTGLIAIFLLGTLAVFCEYSALVLPYVPLTLGILFSVLYMLKYNLRPSWGYLATLGAGIACAASMRINFISLLLPAILVVAVRGPARRLLRISALMAIAVGGELAINFHQLISFDVFVNYLGRLAHEAYILGHEGSSASGMGQVVYYNNVFLRDWFSGRMLGIPLYYFILAAIPSFCKRENLGKHLIIFGTVLFLALPNLTMKYNVPRGVLYLSPFLALLIARGLSNTIHAVISGVTYLGGKIRVAASGKARRLVRIALGGAFVVLMINSAGLIDQVKDAYFEITAYRESRTQALSWLAERMKPTERVAIAKELRIHEYDRRLLALRQVVDLVQGPAFRSFRSADLTVPSDRGILLKLQHNPAYVYDRPDQVLLFMRNNGFVIPSPEVLEVPAREISEEWIQENGVTYVVAYRAMRREISGAAEEFPYRPGSPVAEFGSGSLSLHFVSREPTVDIYWEGRRNSYRSAR